MHKKSPFHAVVPSRRRRLSDAITDQIEQLIVDGALNPGDVFPSERDLAKQLGVSRPSLREALLLMESRGLLQPRRTGGFAVTDITGPTVTDPLVHLLQRHPPALDDVLELRHGLEGVAAYFAAQRATDADTKRLREKTLAMKRRHAELNPLQDADLDADFHMAIAEASHNVALVHVMRGILNLMRTNMIRTREVLYRQPGNLALLDEQHAEIVKAIVARDADAARAASNLHLGFVQASLREIAKPARKRAASGGRVKKV